MFLFGLVEEAVVSYVAQHDPAFQAESYDMTAVPIMTAFQKIVARTELNTFANGLVELARVRNTLMHARPAAEEGEVPLLSYAGKEGVQIWKLADIEDFSRMCTQAATFFGEWALAEAAAGREIFNAAQFEEHIRPVIEKWAKKRN